MNNPFEILSLSNDATVDQVRDAFRSKAKLHHPDNGGDPKIFYIMHSAYKKALKQASQPKTCKTCNGTGKVGIKEPWSFNTISMPCKACKPIKRTGW